jgi:hypothetical protein
MAAVLFICVFATLAGAVSIEDEWFDVKAYGPISIKVNTPTPINVVIENIDSRSRSANSLMAIVIDPFTGTRVAGPITKDVSEILVPNQKITKQFNFNIPSSHVNKTLAAIISVLGPTSTVRGTGGWGFVTVP